MKWFTCAALDTTEGSHCHYGRDVSGELDSDLPGNPEFARRIMEAGITVVSTGTMHIAEVRQAAQDNLAP